MTHHSHCLLSPFSSFLMTVFLSLKANFVKRLPEDQIARLDDYFSKV